MSRAGDLGLTVVVHIYSEAIEFQYQLRYISDISEQITPRLAQMVKGIYFFFNKDDLKSYEPLKMKRVPKRKL